MSTAGYQEIDAQLDGRTVLVTAGHRLARYLAAGYAARRLAEGRGAWERPRILPWEAWLASLWQEYAETGDAREHLLGELSQRALWMRLIEEWEGGATLLSSEAAARSAQAAWRLAQAWRLPLDEIAHSEANDDVRAFGGWAERYRAQCEAQEALDSARLPDRLASAIAAGRLALPGRVLLAGFEEYEPQQKDFLAHLRAAGVEIVELPPPAVVPERAVRLEFKNEQEETEAIARWVRCRLSADPRARIGIVVPELGRRRASLMRALEDALAPARVLPGGIETELPFNVSLGPALAEYPLVASAHAILASSLMARREARLELRALGDLLRSPFLAGAEAEAEARARLDRALREAREPWVSLERLRREAERLGCAQLRSCLDVWQAALVRWPPQQTPSRWIADFDAALRAFGWPRARTLASEEYQTLEAWRELLGALGALDRVLPAVAGETVQRHLEAAARATPFQPQSAEVPVQVLGLFEATGLVFDALWVAGLHDEAWPQAPDPNPLLPLYWQRERKLPHASPERELEVAQRMTARWLGAAREVILSYGLTEADRLRHASPLVVPVPRGEAADVLGPDFKPYRWQIFAHRRPACDIELLDDWRGPVLEPGSPVPGGTAVIADQAACPFRAFARHRLAARPLEGVEYCLTAAERGQLVHEALRVVWNESGSREALETLAKTERRALLQRAAARAIERLRRHRPYTLGGRFAELERERLQALLDEWLEFERGRSEPFRIHELEASHELEIGGLRLEVRLDRVDALASGGWWLIDYKTGEGRLRDWFGERPRAPQLPLYALYALGSEGVTGLAYALVKRGACRLVGMRLAQAAQDEIEPVGSASFPGEEKSWTKQLAAWRSAFERLAEEFRQGVARVDPRVRDEDCRRCEQRPFCRLDELEMRRGRLTLEEAAAHEGSVDA